VENSLSSMTWLGVCLFVLGAVLAGRVAGGTMAGTVLAVMGVAVAAVAAYLALGPHRSVRRLGSVEAFRRTRGHLKRQIGSLYERSLSEQERYRFDKELPVLTREHWIPPGPLPVKQHGYG
jgi:hypothetical protein